MTRPYIAREHEFEPQHGLPEKLPADEHILWQGGPRWQRLARSAFHADVLAVYFGAMLAWRFVSVLGEGGSVLDGLRSLIWLAPLFATGLGLVLLLAWLSARSTVYTLTERRVVMRIGIVLTITFNLPLKRLEGASLHALGGDVGDIALALERDTRIAWLQLWPHVRPWGVVRPQPMLRAVPDAERVARRLTQAWTQVNGPSAPEPSPRGQPATSRPSHA